MFPVLNIGTNSAQILHQRKASQLLGEDSRISCVVILNEFLGRLGNKLFLFASAYGIARTHGCHLYINPRCMAELENIFHLNITFLLKSFNISELRSNTTLSLYNDCTFQSSLMRPNAFTYLELKGYWQAYGHFSLFGDEIRSQLQFKSNIVYPVTTFLRRILPHLSIPGNNTFFIQLKHHMNRNNFVALIGIHIRRGDFLNPDKILEGRTVSSNEFLMTAMEYFSKRFHNNVIFIVASDEKKLYRDLFRNQSNVHVTPDSYSPEEDLAILALCDSSVITGGSFGWWSAFLSNGFVVHDKKFPRNGSQLARVCPKLWYYPPWFLFL